MEKNEPDSTIEKNAADAYSLVWVYPTSLTERLDSATWIETTRELQTFGWKVYLLSKGATPGQQTIRGVKTISLASREIYLLGQLLFHFNVWRFLIQNRNKIDVVLFSQVSGFWLFPLRLIRVITRRKKPLLVMDTRDLFDPVAGNWRVRIRKTFHNLVFWLADYLADGQTAITKRMAELVHINPRKLWGVWPSGVDPTLFAPAVPKRQWPDMEEPVRLIYIGMLLEKRHLDLLCSAVNEANRSGYLISLSLVGEGPHRDRLDNLAKKSNGQIRIERPVLHQEIPELLAYFHIGVTSLPDRNDLKYQASSPIKLFEYMASGLPILATKNTCHTDVVGRGSYAFWADSATETFLLQALKSIWETRQELPTLGTEAQTAVQDWTWRAAAKKLNDALIHGIESSQ